MSPLTGFARSCVCRSGGVRSIRLARASALASVEVAPGGLTCTGISLRAGEQFVPCHFGEDSASFSEEARMESGALAVHHKLTFSAAPLGEAPTGLLRELAEASRAGGLLALVETAAGQTLLLGYSVRFAAEQPLKLFSSDGSTGIRKADDSRRIVALCATDCDPALCFAGQ